MNAKKSEKEWGIVLDCGDNSCHFAKEKTGMRTNGGCRCFDLAGIKSRSLVYDAIELLPKYLATRQQLEAVDAERDWMRKAFEEICACTGSSTLQWKIAFDALTRLSRREVTPEIPGN